MKHLLNVAAGLLTSSMSLWRGTHVWAAARKPQRTLILYDMENCPYCRIVREALTELDLDVMIYPCPKGGTRFRSEVKKRGGKTQFPYLVDPNTGRALYESADIIAYLFETYSGRRPPLRWRLNTLNKTTSMAASLTRLMTGIQRRPAKAPAKPLELYSFESSPYSRPVRELLCALEIPYLLHNVGKTQLADYVLPAIRARLLPDVPAVGTNRTSFLARAGKLMVPYLVDPNTDVTLFESAAIKKYLRKTYAQ